jgi:hypothetical protein
LGLIIVFSFFFDLHIPMILITLFFTLCLSFLATVVSTEDRIVPTANFRTAKNVAFGTIGCGRSHHMWVFEILKEMNERGHNVSFYSTVKKKKTITTLSEYLSLL